MKNFILGALVLGAAVAAAPAAEAATLTVCAKGCSSPTIQGAIDLAAAGDTVDVHPGTYVENIVVDRPLTLRGHGNATVIPAVAGSTCPNEASLCPGSSTLVLVQADDVTIADLRLDGENPALGSGVVARNGIITNHLLGRYENLTVSGVTVRDVYFRGLYASSGGSFTFVGNRVDGVQGDASSVAIFNYGGAGLVEANTVRDANDAISSNWSTGTRYVGNVILDSGSGIHTDNNGGEGGEADVIEDNDVEGCTTGGYGLFAFAPYVAARFEHNEVRGCAVGMAVFGSGAATPVFSGNAVSGHGAVPSPGQGTAGAWVSTSLLGYGFAAVSATFEGNDIEGFQTGVLVDQTAGGAASATFHRDLIHGNKTGANGLPGTTVDATHSWWGCPAGPNHHGCDTAVGTVVFTPWRTTP